MRIRSAAWAGLLVLLLVAPGRAEECDPADPKLVLPDVKSLEPRRARVIQRSGARKLYFTSLFANIGQGPLEIQSKTIDTPFGQVTKATQIVKRSDGTSCTHDAGTFEFHVSHNHWHLNDFAEYQLRKDDPETGEIIARASKISFCLTDIEPLRGFSGQRQVFGNCSTQEGTQGISSGWADVYDDFYPDQYVELDIGRDTPVAAGTYYLINVANPLKFLMEKDDSYAANASVISVNVPARIGGGPLPTATTPVPTATATTQPPRTRPPRPTKPPRPTRPPRTTRTPIAR